MTTRRLTPFELEEAQRVFGRGLNYDLVRIVERNYFPNFVADVGAALQGKRRTWDNALTLGNYLFFPRPLRTDPQAINDGDLIDISWFIHELTHVWQYQRIGWRYLYETLSKQISLGMAVYNYQGSFSTKSRALSEAASRGRHLSDFNLEVQGDIARDYYFTLRTKGDPRPFLPFIREFWRANTVVLATRRANRPDRAADSLELNQAQQFFANASFEIFETGPDAFLIRNHHDRLKAVLPEPAFVQIMAGELLDRARVWQVAAEARRQEWGTQDRSGRGPRVRDGSSGTSSPILKVFVVVDREVPTDGWMQITTLKTGREKVEVIILPVSEIDRALSLHKEIDYLTDVIGSGAPDNDLFDRKLPVHTPIDFFGRQDTANEILSILTRDEPQPSGLFGLRKMGKTSLLLHVRARAEYPIAYVDLQAGTDPKSVFFRILSSWHSAISENKSLSKGFQERSLTWTPPSPTATSSSNFGTEALALVQRLRRTGIRPCLGIFVDEIECLFPQTTEPLDAQSRKSLSDYLTISRTLRGLIQETRSVFVMVAGVDPAIARTSRLADGTQNPFFALMQERFLEPLSKVDCSEMVAWIGEQMGLVFEEPALEFIYRSSGGHPYLARKLCSVAYNARLLVRGTPATIQDMRRAAELFVRDPQASATVDAGVWQEVTNAPTWKANLAAANRSLLRVLASQGPQTEESLQVGAIEQPILNEALRELTKRHVLIHDEGQVAIAFELLADWVREYQSEAHP